METSDAEETISVNIRIPQGVRTSGNGADNHSNGPHPTVTSSLSHRADNSEQSVFLTESADGREQKVIVNSDDNVFDNDEEKESSSLHSMQRHSSDINPSTQTVSGSDSNLSVQSGDMGNVVGIHPPHEEEEMIRDEEDENSVVRQNCTEDKADSSEHDSIANGNSNYQSSEKNVHHQDQAAQPSRKRVAWHTDCEDKDSVVSDTDLSDRPSDCASVDPAEPTDLTDSSSQAQRNNRLREPGNHIRTENLPSPERIREKDFCSSALVNGEVTDRNGCNSCLSDCHNTAHTAKTEGRDIRCPPNLLSRRRPLSANSVLTTTGEQFWGDRALSEDSVTQISAAVSTVCRSRRLSLPLYSSGSDPTDSSQNRGWKDQTNQTTKSPDLFPCIQGEQKQTPHADIAKEIEKGIPNANLVTYRDHEKLKSPDIPGDSAVVKDKPPRPSPSRTTHNSRRRPQTAGPARSPGARGSKGRMIRSAPARMVPRGSRDMRFSKEELQRALPRRNFFSCHNKALKDAGFEVEEENARPRRRRLLFFHHDEEDGNDKPDGAPHAQATGPVIHIPPMSELKEEDHDDTADVTNVTSDVGMETAVQMLSIHERTRRRKSHAAQAVVECKPLQHYLTYVNENPGEYRHMIAKSSVSGPAAALHPSSHPGDNCHTARLVSMGRVFQERHGGSQKTDEVLRAVYTLNPRAADPTRFAKPQRDKSPMVAGLIARKQSTLPSTQRKESAVLSAGSGSGEDGSKSGQRSKPGSEMAPRHEADKPAPTEHLTEIEKRRVKAEEWARTVTTDQLVRAKLQVLKELGHEEQELSQWWLAFRSCNYLRPRIRY